MFELIFVDADVVVVVAMFGILTLPCITMKYRLLVIGHSSHQYKYIYNHHTTTTTTT